MPQHTAEDLEIISIAGAFNPAYESLANVLERAYNQAAHGKGEARHANGRPFVDQPMQTISDLLGSEHGMAFQAIKKIQEGINLPTRDSTVRELLGAIVYISGIVIWLEKQADAGRNT